MSPHRRQRNAPPARQRTRVARAATKRAVLATANAQATRLAKALQALAKGLPNPWDESTDFFTEFTAPLAAGAALDADSLRTALGVGSRYEIDLEAADDTLTELGDAVDDWGEDIAGGFRQLGIVMRATLTDLSLVHARGKGVTRVRVWLFGRTPDGILVGLRTMSTET